MSSFISYDVIIGNFLFECVQHNKKASISDFYNFEANLSKKLKKYDYYLNFMYSDIEDFVEEYSFFVSREKDNFIVNNDNKYLLNRYFRMGLPAIVVNQIKETFNEMFLENDKITCFKCHGNGKYSVPVYGRYDELRYWQDKPCEICKCTGKITIEQYESEQRKIREEINGKSDKS